MRRGTRTTVGAAPAERNASTPGGRLPNRTGTDVSRPDGRPRWNAGAWGRRRQTDAPRDRGNGRRRACRAKRRLERLRVLIATASPCALRGCRRAAGSVGLAHGARDRTTTARHRASHYSANATISRRVLLRSRTRACGSDRNVLAGSDEPRGRAVTVTTLQRGPRQPRRAAARLTVEWQHSHCAWRRQLRPHSAATRSALRRTAAVSATRRVAAGVPERALPRPRAHSRDNNLGEHCRTDGRRGPQRAQLQRGRDDGRAFYSGRATLTARTTAVRATTQRRLGGGGRAGRPSG